MQTNENFAHDSGGGFNKGRGNAGGLRPPSDLCFGTSEIECSASW